MAYSLHDKSGFRPDLIIPGEVGRGTYYFQNLIILSEVYALQLFRLFCITKTEYLVCHY